MKKQSFFGEIKPVNINNNKQYKTKEEIFECLEYFIKKTT